MFLSAVEKFVNRVLEGFQTCVEKKNQRGGRGQRPIACDKVALNAKKEAIKYLVEKSVRDAVVGNMSMAYEVLTDLSEGLLSSRFCVLDVVLETGTRLLVGASEGPLKGVFEVGLVFDPVIGLPIIPGSSLKGAVRSAAKDYCINSIGDENRCEELISDIFGPSSGEQSWVGKLLFFDSYPVVMAENNYSGSFKSLILPDIITPHYYEGGKPVESELKAAPRPVQHVSVSEGVPFRFIVGVRPEGITALERYGEVTRLGRSWSLILLTLLVLTLRVWGVGARTTKGYGYFEIPSSEDVKIAGLKVGCGRWKGGD